MQNIDMLNMKNKENEINNRIKIFPNIVAYEKTNSNNNLYGNKYHSFSEVSINKKPTFEVIRVKW